MTDETPKRRGRPPAADPLAAPISLRFTASERELVERAAAAESKTLARYVRDKAVAAAKRART
ncbi:DUF1778 domain-containing protein [Rathayibacter sp. AY1E1]|uniref:type II toxin -antitoxin system TacA 1-like antitoxin n=1 Tax=Rathayibacter sp. AY1E1 TaxID=2080549 RepID=UPI000CE85A65|nr:DUF1778 domain-containing protein [Rathayibacter sp. AY1E1]PPH51214.1 hypothetical protein C5C67_11910 [Rathayibacter sp. AY1E1]